ncbi:hypothetical protein JOY44_27230 (plasmid) [Phormidium sp. CLA17]|uniref:hypothetical protein n=1 Tax=Leptolyngbya sp. Cla-17 TaxID=2803751 RepID=UPI001491FDB2|nr:hypothetical protein [Leptolyngbya sp. Cla-17]MBM0745171.1 hypothetical protein [Leptolyngbya sp. Cla-17]
MSRTAYSTKSASASAREFYKSSSGICPNCFRCLCGFLSLGMPMSQAKVTKNKRNRLIAPEVVG